MRLIGLYLKRTLFFVNYIMNVIPKITLNVVTGRKNKVVYHAQGHIYKAIHRFVSQGHIYKVIHRFVSYNEFNVQLKKFQGHNSYLNTFRNIRYNLNARALHGLQC